MITSTIRWGKEADLMIANEEDMKHGIIDAKITGYHPMKAGHWINVFFDNREDKMFFDLKFGCDSEYYDHVRELCTQQ